MNKKELLRKLPKIDEVLSDRRLLLFFEDTPRELIVEAVREQVDELRKAILENTWNQNAMGQNTWNQNAMDQNGNHAGEQEPELPGMGGQPDINRDVLINKVIEQLKEKRQKSLRKTINATGVALHTNLGRAKLSESACRSVLEVAGNYSTLEYNIKKGIRGSRHNHVERLITKITGAEAAMVVNNNAAATMLCLSAMAEGKEVIVSRGELVEIGGSFRVPEIMKQSGALLVEVGTTNKTRIDDYEAAIDAEKTAALLKVHTSNYKIIGFTAEATLDELVQLGKQKNVPVIYDLGSGLMVDLHDYGIDEPTVTDSLKSGIDVILFSGDKLLGGPQGGIIAGRREYIDKMKKHPLARILRVDKMVLAALEETFRAYLDMEKALFDIPILAMLTTTSEELKDRAEKLAEKMADLKDVFQIEVIETEEQVGGGSAPTIRLKGYALTLVSSGISSEKLERELRRAQTPIIARISKDKVYLDLRTITEEEGDQIHQALTAMASGLRDGKIGGRYE